MRGASRGVLEVGQVRRPRAGDETPPPPSSRAAPGLRPGTLRSPARSWLTAGRQPCPRLLDKVAQKGPASKEPQGEAKRNVRKRGPALSRRRDGAPRGDRVPAKERGTKRQ